MQLRSRPVLGIDSGFDRLGLCLYDGDRSRVRLAEAALNSANLAGCFKELGHDPAEPIAAIAVTVGPGKFSSIRTGMAFALGLARAGQTKVFGVSVFELLAESIEEPRGDLQICSTGGGRIRFSQAGVVGADGWRASGEAIRADRSPDPTTTRTWVDPRDLGLPLPLPAAQLVAAVGAGRLAAGGADEIDSLRPLYVARPSLGPTPGPSEMGAVRP